MSIGTMSKGGLRKGSKTFDPKPNNSKSFERSNNASTKAIIVKATEMRRPQLYNFPSLLSFESQTQPSQHTKNDPKYIKKLMTNPDAPKCEMKIAVHSEDSVAIPR